MTQRSLAKQDSREKLPVPIGQAVQALDLAPLASQFNILGATGLMLSAPDGLQLRAVIVQVSPNPDDGDVYKSPAGGGQLALSKQGLLRIAEAKGVVWSAEHSRRVDDAPPCEACTAKAARQGRTISTCPHNCGFKAVGAWLDLSGQWRSAYATRYWLYDEELAAVRRLYEKQVAANRIKASQLEEKIEAEISKRFADRHALAETKAKLRVVREVGIKAAYSPQELKKGFLCIRAEPALTAAEVKSRALASAAEIFGGFAQELPPPSALPGPDFEEMDHVTPGDAAEPETVDRVPETAGQAEAPSEGPNPFEDAEDELEAAKAEARRLYGIAQQQHEAGQLKALPKKLPKDADVQAITKWCTDCRDLLGETQEGGES